MVEGSAGDDEPERLDTVHQILAGEYRRAVLWYLASTEGNVGKIESLIEHIVHEVELADSHEAAAIRLHHATLPKLSDAGLIEYDQRSATVRYRNDPLLEQELDWQATAHLDSG